MTLILENIRKEAKYSTILLQILGSQLKSNEIKFFISHRKKNTIPLGCFVRSIGQD